MSYAELLKSRLQDDIPPAPVLPTGFYLLQVTGKGSIPELGEKRHEKAPDAEIRFPVKVIEPVAGEVDDDELKEMADEAGYKSVKEFLSRWKGWISFEIWKPFDSAIEEMGEDAANEEVISNCLAKMRRTFKCGPLANLEEALQVTKDNEVRVIGKVICVDGDQGPRNYAVGSRNLAPVED